MQEHFLVGESFSVDFLTNHGTSISLFGTIVGCVKSNSTPSQGNSKSKPAFFIVQYHQDLLDVVRSTGTKVPAFQLITSASAWGGSIAFERKVLCRPSSLSVIANIDQATPVRDKCWLHDDCYWTCFNSHLNGLIKNADRDLDNTRSAMGGNYFTCWQYFTSTVVSDCVGVQDNFSCKTIS